MDTLNADNAHEWTAEEVEKALWSDSVALEMRIKEPKVEVKAGRKAPRDRSVVVESGKGAANGGEKEDGKPAKKSRKR